MKRLLIISSFIFFIFVSITKAQFKTGDFELSFSGSFSSMTVESSTTSTYYNSNPNSDTRSTMDISFSPGYYIADGVSIEAEFGLIAVEKSKPSQYVLLNLGYTYLVPGSRAALFIHGGYGLANSVEIPYLNNAPVLQSGDFNVKVLNLGAGVKYLITPNVIIHGEVNYRNHNWTENYSGFFNSNTDYTISNIGLLFGFSILLPK